MPSTRTSLSSVLGRLNLTYHTRYSYGCYTILRYSGNTNRQRTLSHNQGNQSSGRPPFPLLRWNGKYDKISLANHPFQILWRPGEKKEGEGVITEKKGTTSTDWERDGVKEEKRMTSTPESRPKVKKES